MKKATMFLLASALTTGVMAQEAVPGAHFNVSGKGEASLPPDQATVHVEVRRTEETGADAKRQVDQTVDMLLTELEAHRSGLSRIDAGSLQLQPHYEYKNNERHQEGYRATRIVELEVSNLEVMDNILEAVARQKATTINNVNYGFSDGGALCQQQALDAAIQNSRQKAQQMAKAYEVKIDRIYSASLGGGYPVAYSRMEGLAMAADAGGAPSYQSGDLTCQANVSAVFLIKD
ncbi:SIMPL domain-containing protein [Spongorhabdus nitratireducens]